MTDKPILLETPPGRMPNDEILLQSFIWPVMCAAINGLQLSLRQECIDAFNAGMKAAKIKTAPDGLHGLKQ